MPKRPKIYRPKAKVRTHTVSGSENTRNRGSKGSSNLLTVVRALKEIQFYQEHDDVLMIPTTTFKKVVKELTNNLRPHEGYLWERDAVNGLQYMTEHILVLYFELM